MMQWPSQRSADRSELYDLCGVLDITLQELAKGSSIR
jgi:hypothetical protein